MGGSTKVSTQVREFHELNSQTKINPPSYVINVAFCDENNYQHWFIASGEAERLSLTILIPIRDNLTIKTFTSLSSFSKFKS